MANGGGVEQDPIVTARYYRMSADAGYAGGMCRYGHCLVSGRGVERDVVAATSYYKMTADLDHSRAICNDGDCLQNGLVVDQDVISAARYCEMAADLGNSNGMRRHGDCLEQAGALNMILSQRLATTKCQPICEIQMGFVTMAVVCRMVRALNKI
jgi:TPR repeat protein